MSLSTKHSKRALKGQKDADLSQTLDACARSTRAAGQNVRLVSIARGAHSAHMQSGAGTGETGHGSKIRRIKSLLAADDARTEDRPARSHAVDMQGPRRRGRVVKAMAMVKGPPLSDCLIRVQQIQAS